MKIKNLQIYLIKNNNFQIVYTYFGLKYRFGLIKYLENMNKLHTECTFYLFDIEHESAIDSINC